MAEAKAAPEGKVKAAGGKARAGARKKSVAARRADFLKRLRASLNVTDAARRAGIGTTTVYRHRNTNARFREEWDAALSAAVDDVESNALKRAIEGIEKPVFYRGQQVGSVRVYSDALAMFMLKAKRPEIYARLAGGAATGLEIGPAEMTTEEAKAEVMRRLDRLAEDGGGEPA